MKTKKICTTLICPVCNGTGRFMVHVGFSAFPYSHTCPRCNGKGVIKKRI